MNFPTEGTSIKFPVYMAVKEGIAVAKRKKPKTTLLDVLRQHGITECEEDIYDALNNDYQEYVGYDCIEDAYQDRDGCDIMGDRVVYKTELSGKHAVIAGPSYCGLDDWASTYDYAFFAEGDEADKYFQNKVAEERANNIEDYHSGVETFKDAAERLIGDSIYIKSESRVYGGLAWSIFSSSILLVENFTDFRNPDALLSYVKIDHEYRDRLEKLGYTLFSVKKEPRMWNHNERYYVFSARDTNTYEFKEYRQQIYSRYQHRCRSPYDLISADDLVKNWR